MSPRQHRHQEVDEDLGRTAPVYRSPAAAADVVRDVLTNELRSVQRL